VPRRHPIDTVILRARRTEPGLPSGCPRRTEAWWRRAGRMPAKTALPRRSWAGTNRTGVRQGRL